jgi:hypothetical protein
MRVIYFNAVRETVISVIRLGAIILDGKTPEMKQHFLKFNNNYNVPSCRHVLQSVSSKYLHKNEAPGVGIIFDIHISDSVKSSFGIFICFIAIACKVRHAERRVALKSHEYRFSI